MQRLEREGPQVKGLRLKDLHEALRNFWKWLGRIDDSIASAEQEGLHDRLLSICRTIVHNVDAFKQLGLDADWEQAFFTERLAVRLAGALDDKDLRLKRYFKERTSITFLSTEDVNGQSLKRAINIAAQNTFNTMFQDLETTRKKGAFGEYVFYTINTYAPTPTNLYSPSPQGHIGLNLVFERGRLEIIKHRKPELKPARVA